MMRLALTALMMAVLTVPTLAECIVFISERFNPGEKALTFEE